MWSLTFEKVLHGDKDMPCIILEINNYVIVSCEAYNMKSNFDLIDHSINSGPLITFNYQL